MGKVYVSAVKITDEVNTVEVVHIEGGFVIANLDDDARVCVPFSVWSELRDQIDAMMEDIRNDAAE